MIQNGCMLHFLQEAGELPKVLQENAPLRDWATQIIDLRSNIRGRWGSFSAFWRHIDEDHNGVLSKVLSRRATFVYLRITFPFNSGQKKKKNSGGVPERACHDGMQAYYRYDRCGALGCGRR
jgi:hypothetical protein